MKTSVGLLGCVVGPVNSGDPLWGVSPASGSPRPKPKPLFCAHTQICQYKGGQLPPILPSYSVDVFTALCAVCNFFCGGGLREIVLSVVDTKVLIVAL